MSHTKSPSKFLSRKFLSQLQKDNSISPGGIEYTETMVSDLLNEKESSRADQEYTRQLKEKLPSPSQVVWTAMQSFQDSMFQTLKIKSTDQVDVLELDTIAPKNVSSDNATINNGDNTNYHLKHTFEKILLAPRLMELRQLGAADSFDRSYEPRSFIQSPRVLQSTIEDQMQVEVINYQGSKIKTKTYSLDQIKKDRAEMEADRSFFPDLFRKTKRPSKH